jgi:15-cis-phytoene synthase
MPSPGNWCGMSLEACAALVERGDPDRFAATMAAPPGARARLWPLYALNLEVARAPWVTKEPMIAEMRLQWWRDVVAALTPRAHEVAGPLHTLIQAADLPLPVLDRLIEARRWDVYSDAFADQAAFDAYLEDTAGGLMWLAVKALGAPDSAEPTARAWGWALGLANFLRAVPELEAKGRIPLVDGRPEAVAALARRGIARIDGAGRLASPALLPAWMARPLLVQVMQQPGRVAEGAMGLSEFERRARLMMASVKGAP